MQVFCKEALASTLVWESNEAGMGVYKQVCMLVDMKEDTRAYTLVGKLVGTEEGKVGDKVCTLAGMLVGIEGGKEVGMACTQEGKEVGKLAHIQVGIQVHMVVDMVCTLEGRG